MDFNSLKDTVSNLSLYDIKAGVRKVQNAVMNFTEMEAKVREATNNEPWGTSSSLMHEIANGTFSYQTLNEIMPMIYRRFTEKSAEEWRQIYKALQLLEFLIKHGSERVIDDARSHLTLLKMLRQFHYIDSNGKDQGVNVRNRAKELAELLADVERIRSERKKARTTKNKYGGVEGGAGLGLGGSSSGRFGGFGSESMSSGGGGRDYGGFSGGVYGDGGGFGGESNDWREGGGGGDRFEEYDEFDDDERPAASSSRPKPAAQPPAAAPPKKAEPPKPKAPEVDLFSFDDPIPTTSSLPASSLSGLGNLSGPPAIADDDDDDFDDFQSATPAAQPIKTMAAPPLMPSAPTTFAAPRPVSAPQKANLAEMVSISSISPTPSKSNTPGPNYAAFSVPAAAPALAQQQQQQPTLTPFQPSGPNYFQAVSSTQSPPANVNRGVSDMPIAPASSSTMSSIKPATKTSAQGLAGGGDAFGALWASMGAKKATTPVTSGQTMGQLAKEKSSAGIWGASSRASLPTGGSGSASGDLLG